MEEIVKSLFRNQYLAVDDFPNYLYIYNEIEASNSDKRSVEELSKILMMSFRKTIIDNSRGMDIVSLDKERLINTYVETYVSSRMPFDSDEEKESMQSFIKYFNQPINRNALKGVFIKNNDTIKKEIESSNISGVDIKEEKPIIVFALNNDRCEITASAIADYLKSEYYSIIEKIGEDKFYKNLNSNVDYYLDKLSFDRKKASQILKNSSQEILTNNSFLEDLERRRQEYYDDVAKK